MNIAIGVLMVLGGISQFFPFGIGKLIVGIYVILFGLSMWNEIALSGTRTETNPNTVVGGLEFLPQIPDYVYRYASFLFSFLGRGGCKFIKGKFDSVRYANSRVQSTSLSAAFFWTAMSSATLPAP